MVLINVPLGFYSVLVERLSRLSVSDPCFTVGELEEAREGVEQSDVMKEEIGRKCNSYFYLAIIGRRYLEAVYQGRE